MFFVFFQISGISESTQKLFTSDALSIEFSGYNALDIGCLFRGPDSEKHAYSFGRSSANLDVLISVTMFVVVRGRWWATEGRKVLESFQKFLNLSWLSLGVSEKYVILLIILVIVQSPSCVQLFVTPQKAARRGSLTFTVSWNFLKFMSIKSVVLSNHLILCHPLLLLPSIFPSIGVFSSESVLAGVQPQLIQGV